MLASSLPYPPGLSALSDEIFPRIVGVKSAKEAWDRLRDEFQGSERVRQQRLLTLKREFEMLKMKESDSVKSYSTKLIELVNQMRLYGEEVQDHKVLEKIMINLPERFKSKVFAIEESCDLKKLTISELCSKLQAHEQRSNFRQEDVTEGAFQAKHKNKQASNSKQGKKKFGDKGSKGKSSEGSASGDLSKKGKFPPCPHCSKTNHLEKTCW
ncbi:uncharacterized protein LOC119988827 [Tripterygium wilfordii]|uniref:uncharacterized protein LOC119988827 n=1 Tax=Tripterygium wilfordii TaxID=458696 RepID=UPI0018F83E0C|nr:uncharacterized protein LOC119988827 [Tripterygium wilfordii]